MNISDGLRFLLFLGIAAIPDVMGQVPPQGVDLHHDSLTVHIEFAPLRYSFADKLGTILKAAKSGILWDGAPVQAVSVGSCGTTLCLLHLVQSSVSVGTLMVKVKEHDVMFRLTAAKPGHRLEFRTSGLSPGYGLGDHSITHQHYDTDITGYANDHFLADGGLVRFVSNFIIYPKQGVGVVLVDPFEKIVHSSEQEIDEGVTHAQVHTEIHYFFGSPHEIYAAFRRVRNETGYPVLAPKAAMFGLGWEAFGALGWNTNQKTVQENVDRYRAEGYPLRWAVIGSGYWPKEKAMHATTSFGMFDHEKYPDPAALFRHFHNEGIKVLLGLRICFVVGGPFTQEALDQGYFLKKDGKPEIYHGDWPESPYYMLDAHNAAALNWYMGLVRRWTRFGVDGYKEDLYGYTSADMRDDKASPINDLLMKQGMYVIERTGYLESNGDLIRINDFNYDQNQDRGPVNSLAMAYSGAPLLYPTLVGGTFAENKFSTKRTHRMQVYMMRIAQWAAVHPGMAMGEPPWSFPDPEVAQVMKSAALLHARLQPYFYSQGTQFAIDGYPWPMTPLPVAFPEDANVYGRGNDHVRGYEWMIGDALLATPLYGDDYLTANTRDVYLPRGRWIDYDTGQTYQGPTTLKNFAIPPEKTPLFVGGSGIVLEEVDEHLVARVYPIAPRAHEVFHVDGTTTTSFITVDVKDWKSPRIVDIETGKTIEGRWERHAYQFSFYKGHSYRLE